MRACVHVDLEQHLAQPSEVFRVIELVHKQGGALKLGIVYFDIIVVFWPLAPSIPPVSTLHIYIYIYIYYIHIIYIYI